MPRGEFLRDLKYFQGLLIKYTALGLVRVVLHMIWLERRSQAKQKKKITAAAYLYQVDNDGK